MSRICELQSPFGDALKFRSLLGTEEISGLFELVVEAVSLSKDLSLETVLGQNVG